MENTENMENSGTISVYREELKHRTRIARCARYIRRRKRRGCTLPSDFLTPAQMLKRNGPVRVFRGSQEVQET